MSDEWLNKDGVRSLQRRPALFHFFHRALTSVVPERLRNAFVAWLCYVAPHIPTWAVRVFSNVTLSRAFWSSATLTFGFCFIGMFVGAAFNGTLIGDDRGRLYFLEDWPNLVNYLILCPLYVGFCVQLIYLSISLRYQRNANGILRVSSRKGFRDGRTPGEVVIFSVLFISAIVSANYVAEILSVNVYEKHHWYVSVSPHSGERTLGAFGLYYAIINFLLLLICLLALWSFLYVLNFSREVAAALSRIEVGSELAFVELKRSLVPFTKAYIVAKAGVAVLMLNLFTWTAERPLNSLNLFLMASVLSFVGLIFVPFPRYYVQMQWYRYNCKLAEAGLIDAPTYEDLRPDSIQGAAYFLDFVIFGAWFYSVLSVLPSLFTSELWTSLIGAV